MKQLFSIALIAFTVSSCSFVKDVQKHCQPSLVSGDIQSGSFNACLKCDSLAKVVYSGIKKSIEKK